MIHTICTVANQQEAWPECWQAYNQLFLVWLKSYQWGSELFPFFQIPIQGHKVGVRCVKWNKQEIDDG
jgi:hypothetical protein